MSESGKSGMTLAALFREHSGLVATGLYVLFTAIGMNYTYWYYRLLGVPILDYAQPGDFLLAGVRTPLLLLFSIVSVALITWLLGLDQRVRQRWPAYAVRMDRFERSPYYSDLVVRAFLILGYFSIFSYYYAAYSARQIVSGKGNQVDVVTSDLVQGPTKGETTLIGSTSQYVFVYDRKEAKVDAVPVESVLRLEFAGLKSR